MTEHLDLRGTLCPLNFVYTKLRLEELAEECQRMMEQRKYPK